MNLKAAIEWLQEELNEVDDPVLLETFRNLIVSWKNARSSEYEDLNLYNRELEEALADIEEGRVYSHKEVGKMIEGGFSIVESLAGSFTMPEGMDIKKDLGEELEKKYLKRGMFKENKDES